jgi:cobyrinic acid a,c-diamide synthase
MALIVAGERSGVGKTTVTLALLAALTRRNFTVQSFKVGPDYIDPMFHRHVTRRVCHNLDPVLTSEAYVQQCFARHCATADYALIEGVMGLFDGAVGRGDSASTAHIARSLDRPILLVLDCSRMSYSIAALVHGYRSFDPRLKFAGVVLNRVGSDRHLDLLKSALEPLGIPILGVLRRQAQIQIPDRHLGLVPTDELAGLGELIDRLARLGETCFDWSNLMPLLKMNQFSKIEIQEPKSTGVRIAIAKDAAFNFYYEDNLELLHQFGAELVFWSPLQDSKLPENIHGLYFGGGFPEMFVEQLSQNLQARERVRAAIAQGIPTYAECGGLMYLCQQLKIFSDQTFPMVGTIPTTAVMGSRLTLGYRRAIALQDRPLLTQGTIVHGHEFHRSHLQDTPTTPLFELHSTGLPTTYEGWCDRNLHASYLHLHWGVMPELSDRFVQQCANFRFRRYA